MQVCPRFQSHIEEMQNDEIKRNMFVAGNKFIASEIIDIKLTAKVFMIDSRYTFSAKVLVTI